jgi:serine/threonine protein kinase
MSEIIPREITESFRLERVLKSSRSGIVLRAIDPATQAAVAIKLIPCSTPALLERSQERFLAAMTALGDARPGAFPALLDHGFTPDASAFMVLEFVDGTRLDLLPPSPVRRLLDLVLQAVDGLETLAATGVSHGNLAPDNVLAVMGDDAESVRIVGFGTAAYQATAPGSGADLVSAAEFRPPERLDAQTGDAAPNLQGDIYSLALSVVSLLHGEAVPLDDPAPHVILPPTVVTELAGPEALCAVLERSLRKDPGQRPATWDEFRRGVQAGLAGEPAAVMPALPPEAQAPTATPESAALIEPDDLQLEGAPGWLAEPPAAAAEDRAPTRGPDDTNPIPHARAGPSPPQEPVAPPQPEAPANLDDGVTQEINVPALLARRDTTGEPATAEAGPTKAEPLTAPSQGTPEAEPVAPVSEAKAVETTGASPPPPSTSESSMPPAPVAAAKRQRAAPRPRRFPLWAALTIVMVAVVGAGTVLWFVLQHGSSAPPPITLPTRPPAPPPLPTAPPPPTSALLNLQAAEHALTENDWNAAAKALDAISSTDRAQLGPAEVERLTRARDAVDALRRVALAKDLRTGLLSSDFRLVHDTLRAMTKEDREYLAHTVDANQAIEEARRAVNLQALMTRGERDGNWSAALVNSTALLGILPRYAAASELRERAAANLEQEADALAQKGRFDLALARLDTLAQLWSDRPGLTAHIERIRSGQAAEAKLATLMVAVEQTERDKAPEKGLELLRTASPNPRWAERFRQARDRLTAQLAALDKAPPVVELPQGTKLVYLKGQPASVTFHITDDHAVEGARLFARREGTEQYVEMPLRPGRGGEWHGEISFAFHQNDTVELFVVATDYSGHVGQLGSATEPLKLKRKRNWLGF